METKELKEILALPLSLHMAYDKANSDGKLDWNDLGHMIGPAQKLLPAIDNAKGALEELKTLDAASKKSLEDWAKAEYDIADDKLEAIVEDGIMLVVSICQFITRFQKPKAADPVVSE